MSVNGTDTINRVSRSCKSCGLPTYAGEICPDCANPMPPRPLSVAAAKTSELIPSHAQQSPTTGKIATALAKAQGEFDRVLKTNEAQIESRTGRSFSYTYADLATVLGAVRKALSDAEIAITQPLVWNGDKLVMRTILMHSSGEWLGSELPILCDLRQPQILGSYLTYARRYALQSLVGVACADDDGAIAQAAAKQRPDRPAANPRPDTSSVPTTIDVTPPQPPARRDGRWLLWAAQTRGMTGWFNEYGLQHGYPVKIEDWSPGMVSAALRDLRKDQEDRR